MARPAPPPFDALPPRAFLARVPVRFSHCDPAGIVYFARYFDMLNGVVEDWFSGALGLDYHAFIRDRRVGLGYAHAACDYVRPAAMGETLAFAVLVERVGGGSLTLAVPAYSIRDEDRAAPGHPRPEPAVRPVEGKGIQRDNDAPQARPMPVQGPLTGQKASLRDLISFAGSPSPPLASPAPAGDDSVARAAAGAPLRAEGALLARLVIATTDLDRHCAIPLPEDLRAAVTRYQELCR